MIRAPRQPKVPFRSTSEAPTMQRLIRPEAALRWSGPHLAQVTPQYIEMILRGAVAGSHDRAWELFDLMEDTWPRLRKNVLEIKDAVRNLTPVFEPYAEEDSEPTPAAIERKQLVAAALRAFKPDPREDENGFDDSVFDLLDARFKGVSILELSWQAHETAKLGTIMAPRATWWAHPSCYGWTERGRLALRAGNASGQIATEFAEFPDDKFLFAKCKTKSGSITGTALLRALAWWWCAANFSADWLLNLAQIFGLPIRWATHDPQASQETVDKICQLLERMGSASWAAFPKGTELELKADGQKAGSQTPQGDMLDRADTQADLLILGQTLTTKMDSAGGSHGAAKVHEGVKYEIVTAAAKFVASVLNDQLFPMLLRLNYGDDSECPTLTFESIDEVDLARESTVLLNLQQAGAGKIIPLSWIAQRFGIPAPVAGEPTLADLAAVPLTTPAAPVKTDGEDETDPAEQLQQAAAAKDSTTFLRAIHALANL